MKEYTMLVPCRLNDGSKVSKKDFKRLERRFLDTFGGYTDAGRVSGSWKNEEGRVFHDVTRKYVLAAEDIDKVEAIAKEVAHDWQQEAIYIAKTSDRVEFVTV